MNLEKIYNNDRPNAKHESLLAGILIELRTITKILERVEFNTSIPDLSNVEAGPIEVKVEPAKKVAPKRKPAKKKTTAKKKGK